MTNITLVTGNANKLREWQRLMPQGLLLESADIDLPEIQSIDMEEIVADKAKRAYEALDMPVIVEDISAELANLNGLPGPFVKFFIKALGENALYQLSNDKGSEATVICTIAFYNGQELLTATGRVPGRVVSKRGDNGFGFDKTFVPDGHDQTYAEMSPEEKDKVSHRSKAIRAFVEQHGAKLINN